MPYANSLFLAGLATLAECREKLSRKFFNSVAEPRSCHITCFLLPAILHFSRV